MRVNGAFELELQSGPCTEDLHFIFESSLQSAGSQMDDLFLQQKAPNLRRGFVGGFRDRFKLPLKLLGFAYQFVQANLGAQLNGGQQLEYTVVQLPGDAPPFLLNGCRGNCALKAGPAIPSVLQAFPILRLQSRSNEFLDPHVPRPHQVREIAHRTDHCPRLVMGNIKL